MSEPTNVSNTLVNQPVNYIGYNPYRWKWIGKWDSIFFLNDFYTNEELNVPQYDLICGEGIVIMDDVESTGCGSAPQPAKCTVKVRFFNYDATEPFHVETFEVDNNTTFTKDYSYVYMYDLYANEFTNDENTMDIKFNETYEKYYDMIKDPMQ